MDVLVIKHDSRIIHKGVIAVTVSWLPPCESGNIVVIDKAGRAFPYNTRDAEIYYTNDYMSYWAPFRTDND